MSNRLINESSPYLLQHAENPVDWYPWGEEAFARAAAEDKPIFLSIGYSTCHWCHVMAHESFEDERCAEILNRNFVSIKVDREERPDIDGVYMAACQAMTGNGGWPTSLFLTPSGEPFFAGTYFPPRAIGTVPSFSGLLLTIAEKWKSDRGTLLSSAAKITEFLRIAEEEKKTVEEELDLPREAREQLSRTYDERYGGFGFAPKFPTPHNLVFLMLYSRLNNDARAEAMACHTLRQMRRGGIYDHIGGGFSRYSTDRKYLVPHFEKMLYDNALLILAYSAAYSLSGDEIFLETAKATAEYAIRELRAPSGGFFSAQDADSEGEEGAYYLFKPEELVELFGKRRARAFSKAYGIDEDGDIDGKSVPNLLDTGNFPTEFNKELDILYEYRKKRHALHLDRKILTSWNSLMISALVYLYRASGESQYLRAALECFDNIEKRLVSGERLFTGECDGKRLVQGFLDDYAFYSAALISLYGATGEDSYLTQAKSICLTANELFGDGRGGYSTSGKENERLIFRHRETYDGATPSGNSVMAFSLTRLAQLTGDTELSALAERQIKFLLSEAENPAAHCMLALTLLFRDNEPPRITAVCAESDDPKAVVRALPLFADIKILYAENAEYRLKDGKTTYYICKNKACLPPTTEAPRFAL